MLCCYFNNVSFNVQTIKTTVQLKIVSLARKHSPSQHRDVGLQLPPPPASHPCPAAAAAAALAAAAAAAATGIGGLVVANVTVAPSGERDYLIHAPALPHRLRLLQLQYNGHTSLAVAVDNHHSYFVT